MGSSSLGIILALSAWIFWSSTPFFFASTGRRIGPFATNVTRLSLGAVMLIVFCIVEYSLKPSAALPGMNAWILFSASGIIGLVFGDHFLYRSLSETGPERTSLVMTLSPAITATLSWVFISERLSFIQLLGMALVLGGVAAATWPHKISDGHPHHSWKSAWNGIIAAVCQGIATVLAREAFLRNSDLSPLYATTIRVASGAVAILLVAVVTRKLFSSFKKAMEPLVARRILGGTLTGPVAGMLCYIGALKYQDAGIVTTITFMTPLLVIPVAAWRYRARLSGRVLLGGAVALMGVVLLGWNS